MEKVNTKSARIINTATLVILPLIALNSCLQFQIGYFSYFGLSDSFVKIGFGTFLICMAVFSGALLCLKLSPNIFVMLFHPSKMTLILVLIFAIIAGSLSRYVGYETTRFKKVYALSSHQKNYILIASYTKYDILKEYNPKTNEIGDQVIIQPSDGNTDFIVKRIGCLKPYKDFNLVN